MSIPTADLNQAHHRSELGPLCSHEYSDHPVNTYFLQKCFFLFWLWLQSYPGLSKEFLMAGTSKLCISPPSLSSDSPFCLKTPNYLHFLNHLYGCNRAGKELDGEKDSAFLTARGIQVSYTPNFSKLFKICKCILSKTKYKQAEKGGGKTPRVMCKAFKKWERQILPLGYMPAEKRLHLLIFSTEPLLTSCLVWGTSVKIMFTQKYLSNCWFVITFIL